MVPWTLGKKKSAAQLEALAPRLQKLSPELPSFPFESEFSHHRPSDLSGTTCAASDGESAPSSSGHVKSPDCRPSEGQEGGKAAKGLKGLFTRSRSNSRVGKKEKSPVETLPPLPTTLSLAPIGTTDLAGCHVASEDRLARALPILRPINFAKNSAVDAEDDSFATFAQQEDLASLLYLVHAAGDKHTTDTTKATPQARTASPQSTPQLSASSSASSPSDVHSVAPTSYYSFLSHIPSANSATRRSPFTAPLPYVPPRPRTPQSDDEYGSDEKESSTRRRVKEPLWTKKSNATFKAAKVESRSNASRSGTESDVATRRRGLGEHGVILLQLTTTRLSSSSPVTRSLPLLRPISTNPYPVVSPGPTLRTILGRMAILRKLRMGVTASEEREIEGFSRYRDSKASEASDWSIGSKGSPVKVVGGEIVSIMREAFRPFNDSGFDSISSTISPTRPKHSSPASTRLVRSTRFPTPESIKSFISRRRFAETHLVVTAVDAAGISADLIRPGRPELSFSPRLLAMAGPTTALVDTTPMQALRPGDRPNRDSNPGFGQPRKDLHAIVKCIEPVRHQVGGARIVMPGPLLLRALAEAETEKKSSENPSTGIAQEEDDLTPLAGLRNRSSTAPPSPSVLLDMQNRLEHEREATLQAVRRETARLAAEVSRLQQNESIRRERQRRTDRDREEADRRMEEARERMEEEKERQRRLAEQQRRSRAMEPLPPHARNRIAPVELTQEQEKVIRDQKRRSRAMGVATGLHDRPPPSPTGPRTATRIGDTQRNSLSTSRSRPTSSSSYGSPAHSPLSIPSSPISVSHLFVPGQFSTSMEFLPAQAYGGSAAFYANARFANSAPTIAQRHTMNRSSSTPRIPQFLPPSPTAPAPRHRRRSQQDPTTSLLASTLRPGGSAPSPTFPSHRQSPAALAPPSPRQSRASKS